MLQLKRLCRWTAIGANPIQIHGKIRIPPLRPRQLCGLTIFWGLRSTGSDRWAGGRFYNPEDGETYDISAEVSSANVLVARIYLGMPLFGKTKPCTGFHTEHLRGDAEQAAYRYSALETDQAVGHP